MNMIKENYSKMCTESLIKLSNEINELQPDAILILQEELFQRNLNEEAFNITKHLISEKYKISDEHIFEFILSLKEKGFDNNKIDLELINQFNFDKKYIDLVKIKLLSKGKENLFIGLGLIIFTIISEIIFYKIINFNIISIFCILGIVIFVIGIWKFFKGLKLINSIK